jgi:hypothetical protein
MGAWTRGTLRVAVRSELDDRHDRSLRAAGMFVSSVASSSSGAAVAEYAMPSRWPGCSRNRACAADAVAEESVV